MLSALTERFSQLGANWARRRQGVDASAGVTLQRRRLYILPTRYGAVFCAVLFAMLLGAINYGSNLAYAMTFLLAGLVLVVMHHCHNNLLGLQLRFAGAEAVFAGETAEFHIAIHNPSGALSQEIEVTLPKSSSRPVDIDPSRSATAFVRVPTTRRGWCELNRFVVRTYFPTSLFRCWTWIHMDARCLVYPRPSAPGTPPPGEAVGHRHRHLLERDEGDFYGLRDATFADSPNRIAWKAYARNDQMLVKQFAGADQHPSILDWDSVPGDDTEAKLSQLARWCLDAANESRPFALRLPGTYLPLATGSKHLQACLTALALFEIPGREA